MNSLDKFLSPEQRERIKACVADVEKTTAGEIAPMIVPASYDYPRAEITGALLIGLAVSMAAAWVFSVDYTWNFIWIFAASFLAAFTAMKFLPRLKRFFIPRSEIEEEVNEGAITSFYGHNLHETRDRTGILIYVSVFERKVVVLADKGVNDKVDQGEWRVIVDMITAGIKEGKAPEAICRAIERCGEIIAGHFPRRPDDKDELSNLIVGE